MLDPRTADVVVAVVVLLDRRRSLQWYHCLRSVLAWRRVRVSSSETNNTTHTVTMLTVHFKYIDAWYCGIISNLPGTF